MLASSQNHFQVQVTGTVCSLWAMIWDAAAGRLRRYMQQVCTRSSGVGTVPSRLHVADGWPGKELQQQTATSGGTIRHRLDYRCAIHCSIKTRLAIWLTSVNSWKGAFWKRVSCHNSGDRKP